MEQDTSLLKSQMIYVSSDKESDGDKDSREDTLYPYALVGKRLQNMPHYLLLNFDSGTKMIQVTNIISQVDC